MRRNSKILLLITAFSFLILACGTSNNVPNNNDNQNSGTAKNEEQPTPVPPTEVPTDVPLPTDPPPPPSDSYESGELLYSTDFADIDDWYFLAAGELEEYIIEARWDGLYLEVPLADDWLYGYYPEFEHVTDVQLLADVSLVGGTNYTYIELLCRSSADGEYVFYLDTGGYWQIGKWDFNTDEYTQLDYGGTTAIKVAKSENRIEVLCEGDTLALMINGKLLSTVKDGQFTSGDVGVGVETVDIALSQVSFHLFEIYVP